MIYIFPFKDIFIGSRIVLYGASQTGYDFYRQIKSTEYCEIVAWVDKNYLWWREMNLPVDPPESIIGAQFDYVVLTAETKNTAESMINALYEMGISRENCFWKNDYSIGNNIVKTYDADRVRTESREAILESPVKYLSEDTLDIVVRVLYAKDILDGRGQSKHRDLYKKMMLNQHGGKEPLEHMVHAYFTEYDMKMGWKAFDQSFTDLVLSIKENGFDRDYFIPVDSEGKLINGRHRLSAAIANRVSVWTRSYLFGGFHFHFNIEWLKDLNFTEDEITEVYEEYKKLKND